MVMVGCMPGYAMHIHPSVANLVMMTGINVITPRSLLLSAKVCRQPALLHSAWVITWNDNVAMSQERSGTHCYFSVSMATVSQHCHVEAVGNEGRARLFSTGGYVTLTLLNLTM